VARQAWCPRCDEVRRLRSGRPCPVCGSQLLAVPSASGPRRPAAPRLDLRARAGSASGQLLPAARAALAGLAAVVLVAGAFLAGRVTRSSATAVAPTAAAATSSTRDADPRGFGGQVYNWSSRAIGGVELTLYSISAGDRRTTLWLEAGGVPDGRSIATVQGLSVTDSGGHQLLGTEPVREAPARGSPFGGNELALVSVEEPLADKAAVSQVQVDAVTFSNQIEENLAVTVVDPRLGKQPPPTGGACPTCKVEVRCESCTTIGVAGATFKQGAVVLLLAPKGPVDRSVLGGGEPSLLVTQAESGSELQPPVDREEGGVTAVRFAINDLAPGNNEPRLQLQVIVANELAQTVKGPWRMRPR
jgi:hypothetical protein